jgi:hypothetical protein
MTDEVGKASFCSNLELRYVRRLLASFDSILVGGKMVNLPILTMGIEG